MPRTMPTSTPGRPVVLKGGIPTFHWPRLTRVHRHIRLRLHAFYIIGLGISMCLSVLPPFGVSALAQSGDASHVSSNTVARSCSDDRCSALVGVGAGSWVSTYCWRDGGGDGNTQRWFRVNAGGTIGWINLTYVDQQASVPYCSDVRPNEAIFQDQRVWTNNGRYFVVMQADGNLVEYGPGGAMWASNTSGTPAPWAVMQADGNFVVYSGAGNPVFNTGTGFGGTTLAVQDDGNLVEYAPTYGPVWASSWHVAPPGAVRTSYNWAQGDTTQCTYLALYLWHQFTAEHNYPNFKYGANAGQWVNAIDGWPSYQTPMTQAMVVWPATPGHVAWVNAVAPDGAGWYNINITERNFDYRGSDRTIWMPMPHGLWFIPAPAL